MAKPRFEKPVEDEREPDVYPPGTVVSFSRGYLAAGAAGA